MSFKHLRLFCAVVLALVIGTTTGFGQSYTITNVTKPFSVSEGGAATAQLLGPVSDIAKDAAGNLYIASPRTHRVFKVTAAGVLTTFAGNGTSGRGGDGGQAASAQLGGPQSLAIDASGNLLIADTTMSLVRKVTTSGIISTFAGTGSFGDIGDGGPALYAQLGNPISIRIDASGNIYVLDRNYQRIRKITTNGIISPFAGSSPSGFSGDGGSAKLAKINVGFDAQLSVDSAGNVYIADSNNNRIRKVDTNGVISTIAGTGTYGFSGDAGAATAANLASPIATAIDNSGNILIGDYGNRRIRKITSGTITTIVGNGNCCTFGDGGAAAAAQVNAPYSLMVDTADTIYIADMWDKKVRKIVAGTISAVAGADPAFSGDSGQASAANVGQPSGIATDAAGNIYIADSANNRIRKIATNGIITTVAGNGTRGFAGDAGAATAAQLAYPMGVWVSATNEIFIADTFNNRVRKVDTSGNISTVAGNGNYGFSGDSGLATAAQLANPYFAMADSSGNILIADYSNNRIRKVLSADGKISTLAGGGASLGDNGPAASAQLNCPVHLAIDSNGNIYAAHSCDGRLRKIDTGGTITTVDNGAYTGVAIDGSNNIFFSNYNAVYKIPLRRLAIPDRRSRSEWNFG